MKKVNGLRFLDVSLSDNVKYRTSFNLAGVQITMRCGYNSRNKSRWIILLDREGRVLLPQTFLKSGRRCELGFISNQHNLHYYVTLRPRDGTKNYSQDHDYLRWANDFTLCFVGHSQKLRDNHDILIRKYYVGN